MKRKQLQWGCVLILLLSLLIGSASADIGPKPSVQVRFPDMEGRSVYATLLSQSNTTGPASAWDASAPYPRQYVQDDKYYDSPTPEIEALWQAFQEYDDPDGFYFLQNWWTCSEEHELAWTYYPPQTFKLLLYEPETGTYLSSGIYEQYAFDSYFQAELDGAGQLTLRRNYDYTWETISLLARIALTVALELGVAWLFRYRTKKQMLFLVLVNLVTQVGLNVGLNMANYYLGQFAYVFWFILLELGVCLLEALLYAKKLDGGEKSHPVIYAVCANLLSAVAGLWLALQIPGIF